MSYQFPPDVDQMVRDRIASGHYQSADEVLRDALAALADRDAECAAIQAGIDDMRAGRVKSLAEVDESIRRNLGFSPRK